MLVDSEVAGDVVGFVGWTGVAVQSTARKQDYGKLVHGSSMLACL